MIDQMFDRAYQQARAEMNSGLGLIFNRIEYDAPWLNRQRKGRHA